MPKIPVLEAADREMLEALVDFFDVRQQGAPVPTYAIALWSNCVRAGFVLIDGIQHQLWPTPEGITYIRRSRGHRGRGHHGAKKQHPSSPKQRDHRRSAEPDPHAR